MDKKAIKWNDFNINKKNVILIVAALAASVISLFYLRNTSGTYPVHEMMAIFCLVLFAYNTVKGYGISEGDKWITILIALLYACSITFANYVLWTNRGGLGIFIFVIMFCVSFFQFVPIRVPEIYGEVPSATSPGDYDFRPQWVADDIPRIERFRCGLGLFGNEPSHRTPQLCLPVIIRLYLRWCHVPVF